MKIEIRKDLLLKTVFFFKKKVILELYIIPLAKHQLNLKIIGSEYYSTQAES